MATTSKLNLKEPRYFHLQPLPDFKEYIENFADAVDLLNSSLTFIDGTPDYVHVPAAACRIKTAFPDAKIMVLLRDPVDRALSHWNMRMITTKKGEAFDVMVRHELRGLTEAGCAYNTAPLDGVLLPRSRLRPLDGVLLPRSRLRPLDGVLLPRSRLRPLDGVLLPRSRLRPLLGSSAQRARRRRPLGTRTIPNNDQGRFLKNANMVEAMQHDGRAKAQGKEGVMGAAGPICQRPYSPYSLVQRGLYVYQLEWWLRLFKPEQLLILNHEEMKAWPERVLDRAISFLDQDISLKRRPQQLEATAADNRSIASLLGLSLTEVRKAGESKNKESGWSLPLKDEDAPETYSEVLAALRSYYKPANEELYRLMEAMGPSSGWTGKFPEPKT
ncbi:hypothetical protein CEUSTIGMA_g4484.t1 [Chlamydomonas eustigma]|uniref:Sulfotransferase n=1 Tax=Chlamydomonas eustigma TaxID=1157962 RepID=A0A250X1S6_9CHLO|nr:hypothetical protein CEUSTIGMA_g4484.t1 [Chlamydomonas eustigma]|eukprot:GAX77037.1 hypothetical protein CEUSTIGMA_g4484.t1 [Chlamydomonas eustigma]